MQHHLRGTDKTGMMDAVNEGMIRMTNRLYHDDAYLKTFDAVVVDTMEEKGYWVALDRSAFYPTSGGQPYDTGTLLSAEGSVQVLDVEVKDGILWHKINKPLSKGAKVRGTIDWTRRFDHMQQHGGEHILAGCIWHLFGGVTRGLHLGQEDSTIDVTMPEGRVHLTQDELITLEELANQRIQQDAPIKSWFPSKEELPHLPLRKPSTVEEHVRVVAAGDFEMVPCGGTHPSTTGQLGLLKIKSITPARGHMRVCFVAGMRALQYVQACHTACVKAGALLSAGVDKLPQAVEKLQANLAQAKYHSVLWQKKACEMQAEVWLKQANVLNQGVLVMRSLENADMEGLKIMAQQLISHEGVIALLTSPSPQSAMLTFARSPEIEIDMVKLLKDSGGKGGGRPDFAQGKADSDKALDIAHQLLLAL